MEFTVHFYRYVGELIDKQRSMVGDRDFNGIQRMFRAADDLTKTHVTEVTIKFEDGSYVTYKQGE